MATTTTHWETRFFQRFAEAAAERLAHMDHDCSQHLPQPFCAIHDTVGEQCDENCLEATRPDLFGKW
jgi:hypothetical protein